MYNDTVWQDGPNVPGLEGFGFIIKKIVIHKAPTVAYNGQEHYNMPKSEWDVRRLLEVCLFRFSKQFIFAACGICA